jgi:pimeloyl-ACP methyl ester carboxylesterase
MYANGHVVLLHAFPLNSTLWRPQIERAPTGWRFVAPDLLDEQGIDRAVIGGMSMGGYVTLALYRLAPERFAAMILADTRATADTDQQKDARRRMIETVRDKGPGAVADEMMPKLLGETSHRERPEIAATVRAMIEGNSRDAIAGAAEAMMNRTDSRPLLSQIAVPTLVVCGEEDGLTPPSDSQGLHDGIADSRLVQIPKAGHLSSIEAPEAFSSALNAFLGELSALR